MEYMKDQPDNAFDLACVDPPYGIDIAKAGQIGGVRKGLNKKWAKESVRKFKKSEWDNAIPITEYFVELERVSKNRIIWGGNYFTDNLSASKGWIFWDKVANSDNLTFSDGELAWTSFDKRLRKIAIPWIGFGTINTGEIKIHPTQKPVKLYEWLLTNYAEPGQRILDTHGGSMSIALACHNLGFDLTVCEIDKDYFDSGIARYKQHIKQLRLF